MAVRGRSEVHVGVAIGIGALLLLLRKLLLLSLDLGEPLRVSQCELVGRSRGVGRVLTGQDQSP